MLLSLIAVLLLALVAEPVVAVEMTSFGRRDRPGSPDRPPPARTRTDVPAEVEDPAEGTAEPAPHAIIFKLNGRPVTYRLYQQIVADAEPTWQRIQALPDDERRQALGLRTREEMAVLEEYAGPELMRLAFAEQDEDRRRMAEEVHARAVAGEDWTKLIYDYSLEPGAQRSRGKTGPQTYFNLPAPLGRHAFALDVGEFTPPVLTVFGYHVARVDAIYPARVGQPERRELSQAVLMWTADLDSRGARQDLRFVIAEELQRRLVIEVVDDRFCDELPNICAENAAEAAARAAQADGRGADRAGEH